jgi:hypothetical protein
MTGVQSCNIFFKCFKKKFTSLFEKKNLFEVFKEKKVITKICDFIIYK